MERLVEVTYLPANRRSRVAAGTSLFSAAHWLGLPIASACGGRGTCGKCRVQLRPAGDEVSAADRRHLSAAELARGWRLSCQARLERDTVCLVPEILDMPTTATSGSGRRVALEPPVRKVRLELPRPSDEDAAADVARLRAALARAGFAPQIGPETLRTLPARLRERDFLVTAVLCGDHLVAVEPGDTRGRLFGVAFDIGTTTVVGTLIDLAAGEVRAVDSALNRQAVFGGDVISRIAYTMTGDERREEMRQAVVETLDRILARLNAASGVAPEETYQAVAVGNSTMLHLLLGVESRSLAVAPFVPVFQEALDLPAREVGLAIHPQGRFETLPLIGAYVGADAVAGLLATGLARRSGLRLFVDIGTNSEIALGSSDRVLATSAPAGPAFEGGCIRAGMPAVAGAIEHVALGGEVELEVIGGGAGRGLCGSGLIDVVAQLLRRRLLDPSGRLRAAAEVPRQPLAARLGEAEGERYFALTDRVRLTQRDIRELQAAKSSVATGVQVLMERLGARAGDLEEVLLAGSFGSSIDPESARTLGLVPPVPLERVRFVGNVAAEGAKLVLQSFRERQVARELARRVEYVELSSRPDFNELFVAGLGLPKPAAEVAES